MRGFTLNKLLPARSSESPAHFHHLQSTFFCKNTRLASLKRLLSTFTQYQRSSAKRLFIGTSLGCPDSFIQLTFQGFRREKKSISHDDRGENAGVAATKRALLK